MIMSGGIHWQGVDQVGQNLVLGNQKGKAFALRRNRAKRRQGNDIPGRRLSLPGRSGAARRIWLIAARIWKITIATSDPGEQSSPWRAVPMARERGGSCQRDGCVFATGI
jgi:hypothetical protein